MKKYFLSLIFASACLFLNAPVQAALLQQNTIDEINTNTGALQGSAGYDATTTVGGVVAMVIKTFLALLGVIFVLLLVIAGFNWMTAAGDEEKINKAKDTIKAAVIGLIIIAAAYSITYFVFANLPGAATT